jgi:hypothetical protein
MFSYLLLTSDLTASTVQHSLTEYNYCAAQFHRTLDIRSFIDTLYNLLADSK